MRPKLREALVVEGRYDKNSLLQVVDAVILETAGFGIYHDAEKRALLRRLAEARGLIVLTDPDAAGFQIRNAIRGWIDPALVKHAYVPDVAGKERRKAAPSKEGKLGVEGMRPEVLVEALKRCGATFEDKAAEVKSRPITTADLYARGLTGKEGSAQRRKALLKSLGLPERMSTAALLELLNILYDRDGFYELPL